MSSHSTIDPSLHHPRIGSHLFGNTADVEALPPGKVVTVYVEPLLVLKIIIDIILKPTINLSICIPNTFVID